MKTQWRLVIFQDFERVNIAPQCSKEMGDPSQNGNVNRCIVSHHATIHLAYGRCPSEVAFFPHLAGLCTAKSWSRGARCGKKSHGLPDMDGRHHTTCSFFQRWSRCLEPNQLYRLVWDCNRTGWSFTWLESQYDNESYGIWCMNQESPWRRVNHCPRGVS